MIGNSDDRTNFLHKSWFTNRKIVNLRKAFANSLSTDTKLSKIQLSKVLQSGKFLGRLPSPSLKTGLPLMKNVINPLAKSFLELTAAASAVDAEIHKTS